MSAEAAPSGLTTAQAQARLAQLGENDPLAAHRTSPLVEFVRFFVNPLVLILLVAAFVSAFLGDPLNAVIIVTVVFLSVSLNFFQTYRSQQAVERLRAQVAPTATVERDGKWSEIPMRQIVPGDVVRLSAGDLVPADALLLQARDLHVNQ